MFEVFIFIFSCVIDFVKMLFTIDVGFTNLGTLMCIINIFFPIVLTIVGFIKYQLVEEFDDKYDNRTNKEVTLGRHEFAGKHSKEYFRRQKIKESWDKK